MINQKIGAVALALVLTGGLNNPFALLILAPVTISATALQLRSILLVSLAAMVAMTLTAVWHVPLRTTDGAIEVRRANAPR